MTQIGVSELRIHPIKGFKRTLLDSMDIIPTGPLNDRRFMLIDEQNKFLSQRTYPMMATIDVCVVEDKVKLTLPHLKEDISFDLQSTHGTIIQAEIWRDQVDVVEVSSKVSDIISEFLQATCKLVTMAQGEKRLLAQKYSPSQKDHVLFADAFPFLLISQASLDDLNSRLEAPVPMDRFRPNIVISGCRPYEEDEWEMIKIGDIIFDLSKPCSRCLVTTTNQDTGIREKEKSKNPLKALAQYRNSEKGILFGQNMIHQDSGTIKLQDKIEILQRRKEPIFPS